MGHKTFVHPLGMEQRLVVADLVNGGDVSFIRMIAGPVAVAYSDPPWNPGNEKWWRRHAGVDAPRGYDELLDAWCRCVVACQPEHVFCEQSMNDKHRALFVNAVSRTKNWTLPLLEEWIVYYGSPGSRSCIRPNVLLHFGTVPLRSDPTGLRGEAMTRSVFDGLGMGIGATAADPCMGKGMTSRQAHEHRMDFIGTELNAARLDKAIAWLLKHGYKELAYGS